MSADAETPRNGIQVIARAAAVLRALKGTQAGLSLGRIAEKVGLPRSTVQRIVGALEAERLVIGSVSGGGLKLGPELHALAESVRFNVVDMIRPHLLTLSRETEETVDLSMLRGRGMIFLDQIAGTQRLRAVSSVGEVFPLTTTANGKACLALMDNSSIEKLALAEWASKEASGKLPELIAQIEEARLMGIAFDLDQHTDGISAAGIAFPDWRGDLYAISVPVPSNRFEEKRSSLENSLKALRKKIATIVSG